MKRLPRDVSRCLGRMNFEAGASSICPQRDTCARYLSLALDREAAGHGGYPYSYVASMCGDDGLCRHKREVAL